MRIHELFEGWFYRNDGRVLGPVSCRDIENLLGLGRLQPGQAVWRHRPSESHYVRAETVLRLAKAALPR
jgi:hypothetical protein